MSALLLAVPLTASAQPADKVDICHKPGTPAEKTLNVAQAAVPGHLGHGDSLGPCSGTTQTTLQITKTGPPGAFPNQEFDYTITVTNTGTSVATGVQVVDTLPSSGSFVSSTPAGTPLMPAPGQIYTIALPDIGPSLSAAVTLRWKAPPEAASLLNSASVSAANAPSAGPANATVPIGIESTCTECGAVAAGTGLRNRDQGTITISGIPAGATVARAVLIWGVLYSSPVPANAITFAGTPITADLAASVSGNLCWTDLATVGYAADVTSLVAGNGLYVVSDPPRGTTRVDDDPTGAFPYTDGASLVVIYAGAGVTDQVISDFSYSTNTGPTSSIQRLFAGINSVGGAASLILAGPDGQNIGGETFTLTGAGAPLVLTDTWDGSDPQALPSFDQGNLWDTDRYDVSGILPAGQTTLAFDHSRTGDCIGVGAAVLQVSQ